VRLALALQTPSPVAPSEVQVQVSFQDWAATNWPNLLQALLFALATLIALWVVQNWSAKAMRRARVDTGTQILIRRFVSVSILVGGVLIVLGTLGASPAGLVTVIGAVGLAFSLAIQDILKNFFAGVYLLLERPFRVGDRIKVKDQHGTVENIGVRTTMLRTDENVQVLVPNALVFSEIVANHSEAREIVTAPSDGQAVGPTPSGPA
jgi:small-conductance mechanosensitive channel